MQGSSVAVDEGLDVCLSSAMNSGWRYGFRTATLNSTMEATSSRGNHHSPKARADLGWWLQHVLRGRTESGVFLPLKILPPLPLLLFRGCSNLLDRFSMSLLCRESQNIVINTGTPVKAPINFGWTSSRRYQ
jgi:hypothetical protein